MENKDNQPALPPINAASDLPDLWRQIASHPDTSTIARITLRHCANQLEDSLYRAEGATLGEGRTRHDT